MDKETDKFSLKRDLGFFSALSTVMGLVIGGGVFFKISSVTAATGSPSLTIFVWILAGFITINAGLTIAELAAALPVAGGIYKYIEYIYGKVPAFLLAWHSPSSTILPVFQHYRSSLRPKSSTSAIFQLIGRFLLPLPWQSSYLRSIYLVPRLVELFSRFL